MRAHVDGKEIVKEIVVPGKLVNLSSVRADAVRWPSSKPAYLIHGDDHGAVAERRAGLRALAEGRGGGAASVELLEGDAATPAGVAAALAAMTLAIGPARDHRRRRRALARGRRRAAPRARDGADAARHDARAVRARGGPREGAARRCTTAVKRAGGQVVAQMTVKPWELPKWAREQAARLGLALDAAAAKALVAQVGERQQRLLRELEKLALEGDARGGASAACERRGDRERARRTPPSGAPTRSPTRSSAATRARRTRAYLRLREQGERLPG